MRTVHFVKESGPYAAGTTVSIEDQEASSAIAGGFAVPDPGHVFGAPAAISPEITAVVIETEQETSANLKWSVTKGLTSG